MYNSLIIKLNYRMTAFVLGSAVAFLFLISGIINITKAEPKDGIPLPVIMYHHISKDSKSLNAYVITPDELEEDFKYLKESGYTAILPKDLKEYIKGNSSLPEKPVIITFDDGFESVYRYAYPLALKYNFPFAAAILGKEAEHYSKINDHNILYSYMTWDEIKELSDSNMVEIANHTFNLHDVYPRKGVNIKKGESIETYARTVSEDIEALQNMLSKNSEVTPKTFVYPYGFFCKESDTLIRSLGFEISFICTEGINYITKTPESLHLLKRYNRPHGITSEDFFKKILTGL